MLACDIDNTLANLHDEICRIVGKSELIQYPEPLPDGFWQSDTGLTIYREADSLEGSVETIRRLSSDGILYVTNRSLKVAEITKAWLERYGFPAGQIIFCGRQEKASIYDRINPDVIAEDDPFVLSGLTGTVLAKQWAYNRRTVGKGIIPITSWGECMYV